MRTAQQAELAAPHQSCGYTVHQRERMGSEYIFVDPDLPGDLPNDGRLSLLRFWLRQESYYPWLWQLGLDIENCSDTKMYLEIQFRTTAQDGFSITNGCYKLSVAPGERLRNGVSVYGKVKKDFKRVVIREILIRPLSLAEWSATSSPNRSVYNIFSMDEISLPWSFGQVASLGGGILAVLEYAILFIFFFGLLFIFWLG